MNRIGITAITIATFLMIGGGCASTPQAPTKSASQFRSPLARFFKPAAKPTAVQYDWQEGDEPKAQARPMVKGSYPTTRASSLTHLADVAVER